MRTAGYSKDGLVWFRLFTRELDFDLTIGFSPMADSDYIDNPFPIVDTENNSVVANSDTPQVLFALQFARPGRPWLLAKLSIRDITRRTMEPSSVSSSRRAERANVTA